MRSALGCPILISILCSIGSLSAAEGGSGFEPIFDGRSLAGWETPDPSYWTVEEGAITGRITAEHPCSVNQYLVWTGGELADFELKLKSRLTGDGAINNGFQFRSRLLPDHDVCGYQVDNNLQTPWLVRLYDEYGRHTLAWRGERAMFDSNSARRVVALDDHPEAAWFQLENWHEYHLKCVGPAITLLVDGRLAAEAVDNDPRRQEAQGILALQLHSGPPTRVQFKDIQLKILRPAAASPEPQTELGRRRVMERALAWWKLDSGGHGAKPSLRHYPAWDRFELNVRADGPGARPGAKAVLLDGAHFEAGRDLQASGDQLTVLVRARQPQGQWNGTLLAKGEDTPGRLHVELSCAESNVVFRIGAAQAICSVAFPLAQLDTLAWHTFVGRYDGQSLALFCDGRLMARTACQGQLVSTKDPLLIGAETQSGEIVRHFRGALEEAAIWARALEDEEIASL